MFKYFTLSQKLNSTYAQELSKFPARFRASLNSISLISLHPQRPQLGIKCSYTELSTNNFNIQSMIESLNLKSIPKRLTPEKRLQSWIINDSITRGKMPFNENIQFIMNEFARSNKGVKIVTDILGYNNHTVALVLIELKSSRNLNELTNQLNTTAERILEDILFFIDLLRTHEVEWSAPYNLEKIAIWPYKHSIKKKFPNDISEVGYNENSEGFSFINIPEKYKIHNGVH